MSASNSQSSSMQVVTSKRNKRATPPRQEAAPSPAAPGTAHVYLHQGSETLFVGNVTNKTTFTTFSVAARRQLTRYNLRSKQNVIIPEAREVHIDEVDLSAAQIIVETINKTDIHKPKALLSSLVRGDSTISFKCEIRSACHAFGLHRQLSGDEVRNDILNYIRTLQTVTLDNTKLILEKVSFDNGLLVKIQQKIAVHTLNEWIPDQEREELMIYCLESDKTNGTHLVAGMMAAEKVLVDERAACAAKVAAQEAAENFTIVHSSTAGEAYIFPHDSEEVVKAKREGMRPQQSKSSGTAKKGHSGAGANGKVNTTTARPDLSHVKTAAQAMAEQNAARSTNRASTAANSVTAPVSRPSTGAVSWAKVAGA